MTNLLTLAQQIEQATEDQQAEMLVSAWMAITPDFSAEWSSRANPFLSMLNAKAYESAAMALVPEGWQWTITDYRGCAPAIAVLGNRQIIRNASTPALALAAACCRAVAQEREPRDA